MMTKESLVVLSMIVKDSLTRVGKDVFTKVLNSTLQVPYKSLILVSDSMDDTDIFVKRWAEEHEKEVIITRSFLYGYHKPTRATARQTAIDMFMQNFGDEWLMFIDDDAILNNGWWNWIIENKATENSKVGEIWGINWDTTPEREMYLKFFNVDLKRYLIEKFNVRGGTHDTMYRRGAIEGIKIPPELHIYEDAYLHHFVKCHGWETLINPIGVTHYHPATETNLRAEIEKAGATLKLALKYGIIEYEYKGIVEQSLRHKQLAYLSLFRPLLGFAPMLLVTTKIYGLRKGFLEAVKRQYVKFWLRWQVLRNVKNGIPDIHEVIVKARDRRYDMVMA